VSFAKNLMTSKHDKTLYNMFCYMLLTSNANHFSSLFLISCSISAGKLLTMYCRQKSTRIREMTTLVWAHMWLVTSPSLFSFLRHIRSDCKSGLNYSRQPKNARHQKRQNKHLLYTQFIHSAKCFPSERPINHCHQSGAVYKSSLESTDHGRRFSETESSNN